MHALGCGRAGVTRPVFISQVPPPSPITTRVWIKNVKFMRTTTRQRDWRGINPPAGKSFFFEFQIELKNSPISASHSKYLQKPPRRTAMSVAAPSARAPRSSTCDKQRAALGQRPGRHDQVPATRSERRRSSGLGTYLRQTTTGAAGNGLGATIKHLRRTTSGAAGYGRASRASTCAAPRASALAQ